MNRNPAPLLVFCVLIIISHGSGAFIPDNIWNLHLRFAFSKNSLESIAPAPGPSSVSAGKFSGETGKNSPTPAISPSPSSADGFASERCNSSSRTCRDLMNMTACLLFAEHDHSVERYILIQNDGETSLKVTFTISSFRPKEIQVPGHQAKKVNISDVPGALISLDAGNGKCIIHTGSLTKNSSIFKQFSSNMTHMNLVYGSYLLFSVALVIGGIWACCKMGNKGQDGNGVPYQELELAEHDSRTNDLEAAEGWDQGWDDDWDDDLKPVNKSPTTQAKENGSANGIHSNTSDRDGWRNDWDN